MVKKKQHRLRHFQLRCWFYKFPGEAFPSYQEKPFYSSCQYSYKALKSSWKQTNIMLRTLISELFKWSLTHTHPLTKLDRFPVPPKTIKRTSSILRQFCVCVAHSTSRIAVFVSLIPQVVSLISLKVRTSRWKHFNFPSSIYLDEFFKSRSGFEIAICLISSKYLLWFQAPAEEYLINVHENLCLIIFYDHRCQHFSSDPKEESVFWNF